MSTFVEAKTIELHLRHFTPEEIAAVLTTGLNRMSGCLRELHDSGTDPDSHHIGRPSIRGSELISFVETQTLQTPSVSEADLARKVSKHLGLPSSRSMVNAIRRGMRFKHQPLCHPQVLTGSHIAAQVAFLPHLGLLQRQNGRVAECDNASPR
jgi:hypothetical protein